MATGQLDVSGSTGQSQIRCDDRRKNGLNMALIEGILLDDNDRTTITGLRTSGDRKSGPPDLPPPNHHSSPGSDAYCMSSVAESSLLWSGSESYTSFRASVTDFC